MNELGRQDWGTDNQSFLTGALGDVRAALERYLGRHPSGQVGAEPGAVPLPADTAGEAPAPALTMLARMFGLSVFETDVLVMCAGMELDAGFASLCHEAGGPSGPTFSLALAALPQAHWSALTPAAPLRYWKMIEIGPGNTLVTAPLRIDERILHYLAGVSHADERLQGVTRPYSGLAEIPPSQREVVSRVHAYWAKASSPNGPWPAIQLVGEEDAGLADVAAAACSSHGLALRIMRAGDAPTNAADRQAMVRLWEREAALSNSALLLVAGDDDQTDALRWAMAFIERTRTAVLLAGREPLRLPGRNLLRFDVRKPTAGEQGQLWREVLAREIPAREVLARTVTPVGDEKVQTGLDQAVDRLTDQFNLGADAIATVGALAGRASEVAPRELGALLWQACRTQSRARLDDLAQRIDTPATWSDLVLPPLQTQILRDVVTQVRQRAQVYDRWGFAARSGRGLGISALFAGVSGTGKTLAAEVMANELQLDLYRVDLSQVVSKYIGETEKNLRRVFDAAETAGAVLLFDEADALFGKRSEVKDSHDRYANIEVSYLLQRMEAYRGLAVLTTNMKQALDPAFTRRIRFVVQFPFPGAAERAEIWRRAFPAPTPVENIDVGLLACLNVAGGNIHNIALGAAFLAADEQAPVSMKHLLRMARAEYAKLERPLTDGEIAGWV